MRVHVLLYKSANNEEGIHSLEIKDKTVVLMFEDIDDAERYCGLLEAQDFPVPTVQKLDQEEINLFCSEAGYESRFVKKGFIPKSDEDRLLIAPPVNNIDNKPTPSIENDNNQDEISIPLNKLDQIKEQLENLL